MLKSPKNYFTVLNKVYQRKTLLFFWTSTNLNLRNDKGKHTCFASALREQMQNIIMFVDKFVAVFSSFGDDYFKTVGSI